MNSNYTLNNAAGITKPDGAGLITDMEAATVELNRLLDLLQRTHYKLIGRHGWGDPDATFIGEHMGWDSGQNALRQARAAQGVDDTAD